MATKDEKRRSREREYEEVLVVIKEMVNTLNTSLEGIETQPFNSEDYMRFYTAVYNITSPHPIREYSQELYDKYREICEEHLNSKVLPSLRGKRDQDLLQELVRKWANYKTMTRWLSRFFHYLERYFIPIRQLPSLQENSFIAFYNLVYGEINGQVRNTVISMVWSDTVTEFSEFSFLIESLDFILYVFMNFDLQINQERNGELIDQELVKSIVTIYVEMGIESMKYYEQDFEESLLKESAVFYSENASKWMQNEPYEDYMFMVEKCLKREKEIVSSYLQATTQKKILQQVVENELVRKC
ncbi:cullin-1 isoform X2 [Hevea brasiliensis]|uniref:cullin-1 isoform X2 n=1 Tax=Hevea brasiliensis TaxID=3981 RepID=UPI0025DE2998|nr:cullin-1 isoform X2 [Hevea brasiliensis]